MYVSVCTRISSSELSPFLQAATGAGMSCVISYTSSTANQVNLIALLCMVDPEKEFFLSKAKISTDDSICYVLNNRILKKQRQSTPT